MCVCITKNSLMSPHDRAGVGMGVEGAAGAGDMLEGSVSDIKFGTTTWTLDSGSPVDFGTSSIY